MRGVARSVLGPWLVFCFGLAGCGWVAFCCVLGVLLAGIVLFDNGVLFCGVVLAGGWVVGVLFCGVVAFMGDCPLGVVLVVAGFVAFCGAVVLAGCGAGLGFSRM